MIVRSPSACPARSRTIQNKSQSRASPVNPHERAAGEERPSRTASRAPGRNPVWQKKKTHPCMPSIHHPPEPPRPSVRPRASASDETSSSPRRTRSSVRVFRVLSPGRPREFPIESIEFAPPKSRNQSQSIHHPSSISFERRDSPDGRTRKTYRRSTLYRNHVPSTRDAAAAASSAVSNSTSPYPRDRP